MNIPKVPTSHDNLDNTGLKTGVWPEDFAAPYCVFKAASLRCTGAR
jgi:hypothetical protein